MKASVFQIEVISHFPYQLFYSFYRDTDLFIVIDNKDVFKIVQEYQDIYIAMYLLQMKKMYLHIPSQHGLKELCEKSLET